MAKNWRVIFAFAGIYFAGAVTGILIAPRLFRHVVERRVQFLQRGGGFPGGQPLFGVQPIRRMTEALHLTPEQSEKIKPIEQRMGEELRRVRRDAQHNTQLVFERVQVEISAVLTPEQRREFEAQIAKGRERMKKFLLDQEQSRPRREGGPFGDPGEHPPPPPK